MTYLVGEELANSWRAQRTSKTFMFLVMSEFPDDYPGGWVVRPHFIRAGLDVEPQQAFYADNPETCRLFIREHFPDLVSKELKLGTPPQIVGVWL